MEMALEAALGPYVQAVVVQTITDAQQCLDYLQNAKAGKAMVVWMEHEEDDEDDGEVGRIQQQEEEAVLQRFLSAVPELQEKISGFAWRISNVKRAIERSSANVTWHSHCTRSAPLHASCWPGCCTSVFRAITISLFSQ